MRFPRRQFLHLAAGAAVLPASSRFAWAQAYPTRPVRIIVGLPAGSSSDIGARLMAETSVARMERGAGRVPVERIPYPVDQAITISPFNVVNVFVNYEIKNQSWLRGSKIGVAVNNLADSHNIVGVTPAVAATASIRKHSVTIGRTNTGQTKDSGHLEFPHHLGA